MRIRFTSAVWEEVAAAVLEGIGALEDDIGSKLEGRDYGAGVTSFMGILVAVDDEENPRFSKAHNGVGYVTNALRERFRQITLCAQTSHEELVGKSGAGVRRVFIDALIRRLEAPGVKLPKQFDWFEFSQDFRAVLTAAR